MSQLFEHEAASTAPQPQKFSRYRSMRQKTTTTGPPVSYKMPSHDADDLGARGRSAEQTQPVAPKTSPTDSSIARSKSRYRRRAPSGAACDVASPDATLAHDQASAPLVPAIPTMTSADGEQHIRSHQSPSAIGSRLPSPTEPQLPQDSSPESFRDQAPGDNLSREDIVHSSNPQTQSMERVDGGRATRKSMTVPLHSAEAAQREESQRVIAEQKRKDLERLNQELEKAQRTVAEPPPKVKSPVRETFARFAGRRKSRDGFASISSGESCDNVAGSRLKEPEVPKMPAGIGAGGRGIVPQKDAPVSAVNAGDRIVSIRFKQHTVIHVVTPETTPNDIIRATAKELTHESGISPSTCVLKEVYGALGLERRLRYYESIRDIMNSWERDTQNQLTVEFCESENDRRDLAESSVPESVEPPSGTKVYLYHSNKPGKWTKRWITLLDNGQMKLAKKQDSSSSDSVGLCHLTDYDIYNLTEAEMRRNVKPPKKHCFAIKSQNKPAMFLNTDNFVHYFCSDDPNVAAKFHGSVQGWRSWYLLDKRPSPQPSSATKAANPAPSRPSISNDQPEKTVKVANLNGHRLKISVDNTPLTLGEFEPLIDMSRFDKRASLFGMDFLPANESAAPRPSQLSDSKGSPRRETRTKGDSAPGAALVTKISPVADSNFSSSGLLGNVYEERKAAQMEAERRFRHAGGFDDFNDGFLNGHSLLNSSFDGAQPSASSRHHSGGQGHSRSRSFSKSSPQMRPPPVSNARLPGENSSSNRNSQGKTSPDTSPTARLLSLTRESTSKPLIDLAPTVQEAPQWMKKGHGVAAPEGTRCLVDLISSAGPGPAPTTVGGQPLEPPPPITIIRGADHPQSRPPVSYGVGGNSNIRQSRLSGTGAPSMYNGRSGTGGSRARSRSVGPSSNSRSAEGFQPPMPALPGRSETRGDRSQAEHLRGRAGAPEHRHQGRDPSRARGRDRETAEYKSVPGRAGTLKVV